jgi:ribose/xylose/arabinose/galactoside ABC-type transport system permease subunit
MFQGRGTSDFPVGVYYLLLLLIVVFFIVTKGSVSPSHLLNIVRQSAPLGVASMGQTLVLLVGGIDLSVGTTMTMVNLVSCNIIAGATGNIYLGVMVSLLLCLLIGFCNGFFVAKFKMQPFLVTMATSVIIQGGYYIYTKGIAKGNVPDSFRVIAEGWIGIIPIAGLLWIGLWALMTFVLRKTSYGQKIYITGGNPSTARLSGYKTDRIIISVYMIASLLAGLGGLLLTAYIGVASTSIGDPYTLNSIEATVIGGTAFTGGIGSLAGTFPGVLITSLLQSLLTISGIPEAGKLISQGLVIAVMVAINQSKLNKE